MHHHRAGAGEVAPMCEGPDRNEIMYLRECQKTDLEDRMWAGSDFRGAKLALLCGAKLLVYLRDDKPTIPFPGRLDLPGGGREGDESPLECVLRELEEEFGISIPATRITWERFYPSLHDGQFGSYFLGSSILPQEVQSIRFGDEGQFWQMMTVREFLEHPLSVESHRSRLMDFMYATGEQFCGA